MRIALFTDSYLPTVDGVVTSVLSTRRQLEAHGHEVVVFAPEDPRRRGMREAGTIYVRAKEFRHYPGYRLAMFPGRETDLIKEMGIDVIHIHGVGFVGIKGIWASWHAKVPRVSTFHTMIHETLAFYSPFGLNLHLLERGLRFYLRIFLRKTHGVVVPSRAILEEILALSPGTSSSRASSRTRTCRSITRPRMRSRSRRSSRPRGSSSWRRSRPAGRSPARTIARSPSSCARASTGPSSSRTTCAAARLRSSAACASPTGCTRPPGRRPSGSRSSDAPGASSASTIVSWPRDEDGRTTRGAGHGRPSPGSADLSHRAHVERSEVSAYAL